MICHKCGKEIEDTSKFCKFCGTSVIKDNGHAEELNSLQHTPITQDATSPVKQKKGTFAIVFVSIIVLVIAAVTMIHTNESTTGVYNIDNKDYFPGYATSSDFNATANTNSSSNTSSGGNLDKFVLARDILASDMPTFLISFWPSNITEQDIEAFVEAYGGQMVRFIDLYFERRIEDGWYLNETLGLEYHDTVYPELYEGLEVDSTRCIIYGMVDPERTKFICLTGEYCDIVNYDDFTEPWWRDGFDDTPISDVEYMNGDYISESGFEVDQFGNTGSPGDSGSGDYDYLYAPPGYENAPSYTLMELISHKGDGTLYDGQKIIIYNAELMLDLSFLGAVGVIDTAATPLLVTGRSFAESSISCYINSVNGSNINSIGDNDIFMIYGEYVGEPKICPSGAEEMSIGSLTNCIFQKSN